MGLKMVEALKNQYVVLVQEFKVLILGGVLILAYAT